MAKLYNWYLEYWYGDSSLVVARGIVTGHDRLKDSLFVHTSRVLHIRVDGDNVIIQTKNTIYECSMKDANYVYFPLWRFIPHFEKYWKEYIEKKYEERLPEMEPESVLIVLGNNRRFYFDSFYTCIDGVKESHPWTGIRTMMIEEAIVSKVETKGRQLDYRYFLYRRKELEFFVWRTDLDTYIENCGDSILEISVSGTLYTISPDERKKIAALSGHIQELPRYKKESLR